MNFISPAVSTATISSSSSGSGSSPSVNESQHPTNAPIRIRLGNQLSETFTSGNRKTINTAFNSLTFRWKIFFLVNLSYQVSNLIARAIIAQTYSYLTSDCDSRIRMFLWLDCARYCLNSFALFFILYYHVYPTQMSTGWRQFCCTTEKNYMKWYLFLFLRLLSASFTVVGYSWVTSCSVTAPFAYTVYGLLLFSLFSFFFPVLAFV